MPYHFLGKDELWSFFGALTKKYEVIAPVARRGIHDFYPVTSFGEVDMGFENTTYPPKRYFLPNSEPLFKFHGERIKTVIDHKKRLIFGIRPCDVNALLVLDKIFLDDIGDPYYRARRENTLLVALNCNEECKNGFCVSTWGNKLKKGYDLLLTEGKSGFVVEVGSAKGRGLVKGLKRTSKKPKVKIFSKRSISDKKLDKLATSLKHRVIDEESEKCLSCCACTISCPTCGCFDVRDIPELTLKDGTRHRRWTSCQIKDFTKVAGGFSFRGEKDKRLRQFVHHKMNYFRKQYGVTMCVGCGRCISNCPAEISIYKIMRKI